jgi:hypothetical protein
MLRQAQIIAGLAVLCCASTGSAQPGGPPSGGFRPFGMPQPGEILANFIQDQLKLDADQKKQLAEIQKEVDAKLAKLLTADQKKSLDNLRNGKGFGFGPPPGFGPPGGGPGFPGGGPGGGGAPPGGVPGGMPPKGFGPPGFGGFGATDDVQKKIGATNEEWKVIGPKVQRVIAARRALAGDTGAPFGGPMAGNALAQAQAELRAVLDESKHTKADVDEKIAVVRKARDKARTDLEEAQRELIRLLTPAQQTIMVSLGHLD